MNLDAIFNLHKVKFSKLDVLFNDVDVKEAIERVNIFINIESIFHMFHNKYMEEQLTVLRDNDIRDTHANIITNTLNLAAHYRLFFTKNKISSNIVFYMNEHSKYSSLNNTMHVKHYRSKYVFDYTDNDRYEVINSLMHSACDSIGKIVDYMPEVYFVTSNKIESSLIPAVMVDDKMLDGQLNIMVTRDPYDLQYVNKNYLIVFPMKDNGSILVTENNVYDIFRDKGDLKIDYKLPAYLLSFLLSVSGDKRRSIDKVKGMTFNSIYKNLSKLYQKLDISEEEYIQFEQLALCIKEDPDDPDGNRNKVINNYMAIDLDRQLAMVSPAQKSTIESQLIDRYEQGALQAMNDKYFDTCPINLIELNNYSKKKKSLF